MNKNSLIQSKRQPSLTFQSQTYASLLSGINQLCDAISPTLGSNNRFVALEQADRKKQPEFLDNGALIARRIVQIPDIRADMGTMLLRQMLWQLYERIGDGSATAAVIFQTIVNEGIRYITAGGNAQQLRKCLINGIEIITQHLQSNALPITDENTLSRFALSVTHDQKLTDILVEVFSKLGVYARIDLRTGYSQEYERKYVDGILWEGGIHSTTLLLDRLKQSTELENVAVFISDIEFNEANELLPIIDIAAYRHQGLVIIADNISEKAIGLLNYINQQEKPFKVTAVKLPTDIVMRHDMLEDLVHTVGGRAFRTATGDSAENVHEADLGKASKIWANQDYFCVVATDYEQQRSEHLLKLEKQYHHAQPEEKDRLLQRLGRLMGASATIYVGGFNKDQVQQNKDQLKNYIKVIRAAYACGLLSGGGTALLHCQPVLEEALAQATSADEQATYRILIQAIRSPAQTILENAGYNSGLFLEQISKQKHYALDDNAEIHLTDAPFILDSAEVIVNAVESAIRTAALTLSIDVLVHHRNPEFSATP